MQQKISRQSDRVIPAKIFKIDEIQLASCGFDRIMKTEICRNQRRLVKRLRTLRLLACLCQADLQFLSQENSQLRICNPVQLFQSLTDMPVKIRCAQAGLRGQLEISPVICGMEISCGQPFDITGPVHSNGHLYVEPDSSMTFESEVGAVLDVLFSRDPFDTRGHPAGGVTYVEHALGQPQSGVPFLTLPIGTDNTPEAVREIIEPPPPGEDPNSPLGILRYYNSCDMLVTVSDTGVTASINHSATTIPTDELMTFVSITNNFYDGREGKTVRPIDLNIGNLVTWGTTNTHLLNPSSVYVDDRRTPLTLSASDLGAVRVVNGATLPPNGLTVATGRPLYVWKDYNSDSANRGTANTSFTQPASLVADAITILSDGWHDNYGSSPPHNATATTVNAAFLTGVVETTLGHYSGGMENFPRFLETWTGVKFTYNGSMVKMFPSLYATNVWRGSYYDPPVRIWAFDTNFRDPTRLPPKTPSVLKVFRHQWATLPPGQTVAP